MNDIFSIFGISVIACGFIVLLKQHKPELAFAVLLSSGIILLLSVVGLFKEVFSAISNIAKLSEIDNKNLSVLFKCAGICFITKTASETCNDFGQSSLSSKVDLAGKVLVLITALPFFGEITEIIKTFIEI